MTLKVTQNDLQWCCIIKTIVFVSLCYIFSNSEVLLFLQCAQLPMALNSPVKLSQSCVYTVSQKNDTTQLPTIILTRVVWFQKFLAQILLRESAIERWFIFPPHLFTVHTLGNFTNLKITKSAVKEHLFHVFENKPSYFLFICPWFYCGLMRSWQQVL